MKSHPKSVFRETDLYVTVEPCIMCASLLRQYHIRHVYFGCANERFGGTKGVLSLHMEYVFLPRRDFTVISNNFWDSPAIDPPYGITGGIFRKEAIMLLRRFYVQENEKGTYTCVSRMSICY